MNDIEYRENVLAIFPNIRGLGFAYFTDDLSPKYAGMAIVRPSENIKCMKRIDAMVQTYQPKILLLPAPSEKLNRKHKRIQVLLGDILNYAKKNNIQVSMYSREQIRLVFEQFGARSKLEIAEKICVWMSDLEKYKPPHRKSYMPEDYYQGMFDAISLFVTHLEVTK